MDQEIKDYLERRLILLATKDDIEKMRQETNANFRKLREESKSQVTERRQKIKADMEKIGPNSSTEIGPTREEMKEWVRKIENGNPLVLGQFRQAMGSFLQGMKETGEAPAIPSGEGIDKFHDQILLLRS